MRAYCIHNLPTSDNYISSLCVTCDVDTCVCVAGGLFPQCKALDLVRKIAPRRAYLVGMSCRIEHHEMNAKLAAMADLPCPVELGYDGLIIDSDL